MPYIHVTLATGRSRALKRELIVSLTDAMQRVLEVARADIHVLLWELPTENIGEAGEEPSAAVTNNLTVVISQGRPTEVVLVLIKTLTDVAQEYSQSHARTFISSCSKSRSTESARPASQWSRHAYPTGITTTSSRRQNTIQR